MTEDFYELRQINPLEFEYDIAISEERVDNWLVENFKRGVDFDFGSGSYGTHACTVHVRFFNQEAAVAFKLRWQ